MRNVATYFIQTGTHTAHNKNSLILQEFFLLLVARLVRLSQNEKCQKVTTIPKYAPSQNGKNGSKGRRNRDEKVVILFSSYWHY